jgi:uncharacterized membrane protein YedE/YeeE
MTKKIIKFIAGFFVGSLLAFSLTYLFGYIAGEMGIRLYESESDQQRNFNVAFVIWLIISIVFGYFASKINKKSNN